MDKKQSDINPEQWLKIANKRAPISSKVTQWNSGLTTPEERGYYERHFTDGNYQQYWNGNLWLSDKHCKPHWRQIGDYPSWRAFVI